MNSEFKNIAIDYLKSSISLSTFAGCTNQCRYCIVGDIKDELAKIERIQTEEEAVQNLFSYNYWINGRSILSINNRTDPFLNDEISQSTYQILHILEKCKIKNIILLITKMNIPQPIMKKIDDMKLNIILFYSYSGIKRPIEKFSFEYREKAICNIANNWTKHMKIHYIRPIIPQINDDRETIKYLLEISKRNFDACVISGIRMTPKIASNIYEENWEKEGHTFSNHKILSDKVKQNIIDLRAELKYEKVFYNTSCAVSYVNKMPDYNCTFDTSKCSNICPNYEICNSYFCDINLQNKIELLKKRNVNCKIEKNSIKILDEVGQDKLSFYTHLVGAKCKADCIILSGSEVLIKQ